MYPLATAEDGVYVPQVEPGHIGIRGPTRSQLESEVGHCRERLGIAGQHLHVPGRLLQKRHRAHQHRVNFNDDRSGDSE